MSHGHDPHAPHDPDHAHGPAAPGAGAPARPAVEPALDAANQSLADALRRSFAVLRGLMLVLLVAYVLSGWTRVQEGEVGFIVRLGSVVGGTTNRILKPGWHWAFPYPIDQVITVGTQKERRVEGRFLFNITDDDKIRGVRRVTYASLSPYRDNYLLTGDLNIVHVQVACRYRVVDPIAYVTHVHDLSPADDRPGEYELLSSVVSDATIAVAGRTPIKAIIGAGQQEFLEAIAEAARARLAELARRGQPLGLEIIAVIAPQIGGVEGILPPRQVIEQFDLVLASEQKKIRHIADAQGAAQETLRRSAGGNYAEFEAAIEAEFDALLAVLQAEQTPGAAPEVLDKARTTLAERRKTVDTLLHQTTGEVQKIINDAIADRDRVISETLADVQQVSRLEGEYRRNGPFLVNRLRTEFLESVLSDPELVKFFAPDTGDKIWLNVPRAPEDLRTQEQRDQDSARRENLRGREGFINPKPLKTTPEYTPN
ncbi:MAG: SPFH domain-containing protein [Phycisphaerae bacterium]